MHAYLHYRNGKPQMTNYGPKKSVRCAFNYNKKQSVSVKSLNPALTFNSTTGNEILR